MLRLLCCSIEHCRYCFRTSNTKAEPEYTYKLEVWLTFLEQQQQNNNDKKKKKKKKKKTKQKTYIFGISDPISGY